MPPNPSYTSLPSTSYPHYSGGEPPSPQPLDLSLSRSSGRSSPQTDNERAPTRHAPLRYSPYRTQTPSPNSPGPIRTSPVPYITQPARIIPRTSPAPFTNQRTSSVPRASQMADSPNPNPNLYHELYTASNVLNEIPGSGHSSGHPSSHQYDSGSQEPQNVHENHQSGDPEDDQVIIMDLEPAPTFRNRGGSNSSNSNNAEVETYNCDNSQFSHPVDPKPFPQRCQANPHPQAQPKNPQPAPRRAPAKQQLRPDSSTDMNTSPSIRQPASRSQTTSSPASTAASYKPYKSSSSAAKASPSLSSLSKGSSRSSDSPQNTWFQNQSSAILMVRDQLLKLDSSLNGGKISDLDEVAISVMFANIKPRKGVERFERDGVPKIRVPMHQLIETQVEESLLNCTVTS